MSENASANTRPNRSLLAKSAARLVAVQLLYQKALSGETLTPEKLIARYSAYVEENSNAPKEAGLPPIAPDRKILLKLLSGVDAHDAALTGVVAEHLREGWKLERMSPLLIAILKLAAYELDAERKLATGVIVNEYVTLANRFIGEDEANFVQAALHAMAKKMRD